MDTEATTFTNVALTGSSDPSLDNATVDTRLLLSVQQTFLPRPLLAVKVMTTSLVKVEQSKSAPVAVMILSLLVAVMTLLLFKVREIALSIRALAMMRLLFRMTGRARYC